MIGKNKRVVISVSAIFPIKGGNTAPPNIAITRNDEGGGTLFHNLSIQD